MIHKYKTYNVQKFHKFNINYLKQFPIGDVTVIIHVVDPEGEPQLRQLVPLDTELGHPLYKL